MNKKAQVSIFIIIGAIIVISAIGLFTFSGDNINFLIGGKYSKQVEEYVETCMVAQIETAMIDIAAKGGHYYTETNKFTHKDDFSQGILNSEGVSVLGNNIPYWYYFNDKKGNFVQNIPSFEDDNKYSIKNQIKRYVKEKINQDCIQNFITFKDTHIIKYDKKDFFKNFNIEFSGASKKVIAKLSMPLQISPINDPEKKEVIQNFEVNTENTIYQPYLIATDIVKKEIDSNFLELRTLLYTSIYRGKDSDSLPPFTGGVDVDFGESNKAHWILNKVKKQLKEILTINMQKIQFANTNPVSLKVPDKLKNNPLAKGYISSYIENFDDIETKGRNYNKYNINLEYNPLYPLYLKINNKETGIVSSEEQTIDFFFFQIGIKQYNFRYEITYPIVFTIKSKNFKKDKTKFEIAIETNIKSNNPLSDYLKYVPENVRNEFEDISLLQNDLKDEEILGEEQNPLICSDEYYNSKNVSFEVIDKIKKLEGKIEGIEGANIKFNCKGITSCYMGKTTLDERGRTFVNLKLPNRCEPGKITLEKYGSTSTSFQVTTEHSNNKDYGEIEYNKGKEIKAQIELISINSPINSLGSKLNKDESAIIILTDLENPTQNIYINLNGNDTKEQNINLIPSNYSLKILVTKNINLTIKKGKFEDNELFKNAYDNTLDIEKKQEIKNNFENDVEDVNLNNPLIASSLIENFEVKEKDILNKEKIIFKTNKFELPKEYRDLLEWSENLEGTRLLLPIYK